MLELLIALLIGHVAIVVVGHMLLLQGTISGDENEGRDPTPPPVHLGRLT
jgi:hypothetical protein